MRTRTAGWILTLGCLGTLVLGVGSRGQSSTATEAREPEWASVSDVLVRRCVECHGGEQLKSGFRLATGETFAAGGDRGPVINADDPASSRLLEAISYRNPELAMPPSGRLPQAEIDLLGEWVGAGAPWPADAALADPARVFEDEAVDLEGAAEWWAYRPLDDGPVPESADTSWNEHPIDAYIRVGMEEAGLTPAPEAGASTLLRRATYAITGLPPTVDEVREFERDVGERGVEAAMSRLVDRLLASPAYGEHWARHWLDLVRYAETNGYERDATKTNIWRYRDWVIRALNDDMGYDRFIMEQLAGDELRALRPELLAHPDDERPLIATGYYRLCVWDDEPSDPAQARADEIADIVDTTGQILLGTTVGCARCHDHKADPVSQKDYYALTAFFNNLSGYGGGAFGQHLGGGMTRPIADEPRAGQMSPAERDRRVAAVHEAMGVYIERMREAIEAAGADRDEARTLVGDARRGPVTWKYHEGDAPDGWARPGFDDQAWAEAASGFGQPVREAVVGTEWTSEQIQLRTRFGLEAIPSSLVLSIHHDEDAAVFLNGVAILELGGYRVDYTEVQLSQDALDALVVGSNVLAVACRNRTGPGYIDVGLRTGWLGTGEEVWRTRLAAQGDAWLDEADSAEVDRLFAELTALERAPVDEAYPALIVTEHGPEAPVQHVLLRGSAHAPGEAVEPGVPEVFTLHAGRVSGSFTSSATTTGRRLALADWLVTEGRFITARVMANRLWQYHTGRGLCRSPGDFGRLGVEPTHPGLLDHLALKLIEVDWSLKDMHRYIMSSRTYRMSSVGSAASLEADPLNDHYSRFDARRLTAEEYRDSVLAVSGALTERQYGPSVYPPMAPEVLATASRPDQAWGRSSEEEGNRRSVYVFVKRSLRLPLLENLDQPSPDMACPERFPTNVPTQALITLNGDFVQGGADRFAQRLRGGADDLAGQVRLGVVLALGREPGADEVARHVAFVRSLEEREGLDADAALALYCLTLFNLNEFMWVD